MSRKGFLVTAGYRLDVKPEVRALRPHKVWVLVRVDMCHTRFSARFEWRVTLLSLRLRFSPHAEAFDQTSLLW